MCIRIAGNWCELAIRLCMITARAEALPTNRVGYECVGAGALVPMCIRIAGNRLQIGNRHDQEVRVRGHPI